MIRLLEKYDGSDLRNSHYSYLIRAHLEAYGTAYDFCRFFEIVGRRRAGIIALFNGSAVADVIDSGQRLTGEMKREMSEFVEFQQPVSFEIPHELVTRRGFSGYNAVERTFFDILPADSFDGITEPEPERVFKTVYGDRADYGLWLTDTMRRVNRGLSRLYCYKSSVLTVRFTDSGRAYITDVATPPEDRGKGYARTLLGGVSKLLREEGVDPYLAAKPELCDFYRELGYPAFAASAIYERVQK